MKNTFHKLAAMRRYMNLDYIFSATALTGCAALLIYATFTTIEVICR